MGCCASNATGAAQPSSRQDDAVHSAEVVAADRAVVQQEPAVTQEEELVRQVSGEPREKLVRQVSPAPEKTSMRKFLQSQSPKALRPSRPTGTAGC